MQATTRMRVAVTTFVAVLTISTQPSAQSQIYTTIDVPGSAGATAASINQAGVITGSYTDANFVSHGFLRAADGTIATFDAPGAGTGMYQGTSAAGISPAGAITGWYTDAIFASHGFLRAVDGTITSFDVPGSGGIQPLGINPAGVITGNYLFPAGEFLGFQFYEPHGFVRDAKGTLTLIAPSTWFDIEPQAINSAGTIARKYQDGPTALWGFFLRAPDGNITAIDNLPGVSFPVSVAIDQEGSITGSYIDTNVALDSFVRTADGQVRVIADPNAGTGFFQGTTANSINAAGQIAGSYTDSNYVSHGFLRNP